MVTPCLRLSVFDQNQIGGDGAAIQFPPVKKKRPSGSRGQGAIDRGGVFNPIARGVSSPDHPHDVARPRHYLVAAVGPCGDSARERHAAGVAARLRVHSARPALLDQPTIYFGGGPPYL